MFWIKILQNIEKFFSFSRIFQKIPMNAEIFHMWLKFHDVLEFSILFRNIKPHMENCIEYLLFLIT